MRLEAKLGLTSSVLILTMLLCATAAHLRVRESSQHTENITASRMPLLRDIFDLRTHVGNSVRALQADLLSGAKDGTASKYRLERADGMAKAEASLARIEAAARPLWSPEDVSRLERVQSGLTSLRSLQEGIEHLDSARASREALANTQQINELNDQISDGLERMIESQELQARQDTASLERSNQLTLRTLWLAVLASCVLGGTFSTLVGRKVTRAVGLVASRANAIAAGDLTGSPLVHERDDEIGTLAAAMNQMQASLSGIIGTVADTAGSLTGSAASMRRSSEHIHQRMDEQSQQTQQAATAMQEMSASIAEVSRHTQSAAETARSAVQTARDGGTIVKEVLGSMRSIATSSSDVGATMGVLGEDSRKISQVVTVIDEIARKTNLLALNAAIEAARAGEQGRGFAVVAAEVRRLAESTALATSEIATMIGGIQARTRTAIANVEQGSRIVEQGAATTTQAGEALERIIGMAERVDRMITQIAIAAAQQATAADQSSASLDSIHSLSNENVKEMATTAAGIEDLRGTAVTLERQVDRFQVVAA